jgi:WD40 repeat protein
MPGRKNWKRLARDLAIGALVVAALVALHRFARGPGPRGGVAPSTSLEGHRLPVQVLAFAPDGATLTSAAFSLREPGGWEVAVWGAGADPGARQRTEHAGAIRCLTLAPGGKVLAIAGQDRSVWLREVTSSGCRLLGEHPVHISALAVSGDGNRLATADFENVVTVWDRSGDRPKVRCEGTVGPVSALAFTPDGRSLVGAVNDMTIRLWDVATGAERGVLPGHASTIVTLAFSRNGRFLACGDLGGIVKLWDVTSRTERAQLATAEGEVAAVAFSPDGATLAVAVGKVVQLWDVVARHPVANLEGHTEKVTCLAYTPDGTLLASGSYDRTVRLWNVARYRSTPR